MDYLKVGIPPLDENAMRAARDRQQRLTKPAGSLGRLEDLAIALAGMTGQPQPQLPRKTVVVMAGDHGVAAEGVSAYPSSVTAQMVANFLRGGAAINVLARQQQANVLVVDMGVAVPLPPQEGLIIAKIGAGTANMVHAPAMTRTQAHACIEAGIALVERELAGKVDLVATGDMGIGNTTASSAIVAAITGAPVAEVTGRGTGIDDRSLAQKVEVIERALAKHRPDASDPLDVLAKVGGFEIGGLAGLIIGAAQARIPIVLDGFISGAAALLAIELCPAARSYLIAAHTSVERGHRLALEHMELMPLLNLNLRLGEGSGAALAFGLIESSLRILSEMATFDEAGVSERTPVEENAASGAVPADEPVHG